MKYMKAALTLSSFIRECNSRITNELELFKKNPNQMILASSDGRLETIIMDSFSDTFVNATLAKSESSYFLMTDIATTCVNEKELSYILYKAYHHDMSKGMVFFQPIEMDKGETAYPLEFSNMEENIFYKITEPDAEESSCNAMETDKGVKDAKNIVFLIGHTDEQRLSFDIERLIIDTAHNVSKNRKQPFHFIVHITHFGGKPSSKLRETVSQIEKFYNDEIYPQHGNAHFEFSYEEDGAL